MSQVFLFYSGIGYFEGPVFEYVLLKNNMHYIRETNVFSVLIQIFDSFDLEKKGNIGVDMIGQILDMLGHQLSPEDLAVIIT